MLRTSFLKHTPVGKKTQDKPRTAAAHLRYISRLSATDYVESRHMPSHYWAAQGFLNEREFRIRSNGRVCDKLILVYPQGFKLEHAVEATRAFMDTVSKGRAPYYFTLQNFTDSTENPHAHIIFVDEDVYGRKRVFRTSDLNSTERLKDAWESEANAVLEREGYSFRLDREAVKELKREQANENQLPAAEIAEILPVNEQATNAPEDQEDLHVETAAELPPDAPEQQLPESPETAHAHEPEQEQDMGSADRVAQGLRDNGLLPEQGDTSPEEKGLPGGRGRMESGPEPQMVAERVRAAHQLGKRATELHMHRRLLLTAVEWRERAQAVSQQAGHSASRLNLERQTFENQHTIGRFNGRAELKGWQAPSWSILPKAVRGWQSAERRAAAFAQQELAEKEAQHARLEQHATETARAAAEQARGTRALADRIDGYAAMTPDQQREALQDMERAEEQIEDSQKERLESLSAEDVFTAFKMGEITADEALAAAQAMGHSGLEETIRQEMEQEEGLEAE